MEHNYARNFALVLDPTAFHLHKKSSHGSSRLGYSELEGCCLALSCSFYSHLSTKLPPLDRDPHEQVPHQPHISVKLFPQSPLHYRNDLFFPGCLSCS